MGLGGVGGGHLPFSPFHAFLRFSSIQMFGWLQRGPNNALLPKLGSCPCPWQLARLQYP